MQAPPTDPQSIGAVVLALIALMQLANLAIGIYSRTRRQPPLAEDLPRLYATKRELAEVKSEFREELKEIRRYNQDIARETFAKIDTQTEAINHFKLSVGTQLGSINTSIRNLEQEQKGKPL